MTSDDIYELVMNNGKMVQETFLHIHYACVSKLNILFDYYDSNVIALICYNVTRNIIAYIYDNQSLFADKFYISKRSLERAHKDLERMPKIEYPDEYDVNRLNIIEQMITKVYYVKTD